MMKTLRFIEFDDIYGTTKNYEESMKAPLFIPMNLKNEEQRYLTELTCTCETRKKQTGLNKTIFPLFRIPQASLLTRMKSCGRQKKKKYQHLQTIKVINVIGHHSVVTGAREYICIDALFSTGLGL